jgi:pyruvate/2-oxoglutarate dehydrogenase complex dihydrolipoamide acyltransferase (E2) component
LKKENFNIIKFPSSRLSTFDVGVIGKRKHHIAALIELDVTDARERLKKLKAAKSGRVSFTAWILKCIAQALSENKEAHAVRKGRRKLVLFDDVDISILVEKEFEGKRVPLPLLIRAVDKKSCTDIYNEIEEAKKMSVLDEEGFVLSGGTNKYAMKMFLALPQPIRLLIWRWILKNPSRLKKLMGTAVVTSVGMIGNVRGWLLPVSIHPVCFALGSIVKKPGVVKNEIKIREFLEMTVLIDHNTIDGAPAARFVARLSEIIEDGSILK